jgi:nitric oxide reductase NorE protein
MSAVTAPRELDETIARRLPGDRDVWIFIIAELLMFGAFFVAYIVDRAGEVELFNASQLTLDWRLGALNTLLLVSSSWAVVQAVCAARRNERSAVPRYLGLAIALGIAFMIVKFFEYSAKFGAGLTMMTNTFYMFYFCLTMIHLLHVVGGTVILTVLWSDARGGAYNSANSKGLETGASYWHMVDLLWIFLFLLLYVLK